MKPTGATKEATVSEQAIEIIKDCSNWSDIRYRILPRVEALISERERLREALRRLRDSSNRHTCNGGGSNCDMCSALELADATLNDATPGTSAGGG